MPKYRPLTKTNEATRSDTMATKPSLLTQFSTELRYHDAQLDRQCRAQLGISVKAFKLIRAITQLVGVLLGFYAMHLGVDLELALLVALAFYVGPEGAEKVIMAKTTGADD